MPFTAIIGFLCFNKYFVITGCNNECIYTITLYWMFGCYYLKLNIKFIEALYNVNLITYIKYCRPSNWSLKPMKIKLCVRINERFVEKLTLFWCKPISRGKSQFKFFTHVTKSQSAVFINFTRDKTLIIIVLNGKGYLKRMKKSKFVNHASTCWLYVNREENCVENNTWTRKKSTMKSPARICRLRITCAWWWANWHWEPVKIGDQH